LILGRALKLRISSLSVLAVRHQHLTVKKKIEEKVRKITVKEWWSKIAENTVVCKCFFYLHLLGVTFQAKRNTRISLPKNYKSIKCIFFKVRINRRK